MLRNAANDYAPLTPITANGGAYSALIAPGSYDLYYRHSGASVALPSNDFAVLQRGLVVGSAPLTLDIDVPVGTVSGTVTVAGKVFHDPTDNEEGLIDLHSATYGRARLASTLPADGSYSALVIAGSYDVVYQHATSVDTPGNALPGNGAGKVRSGISVDRGATLSLDLDVPVSTVTVALEINGAPVTNQAELTLRNATDGIELARTAPGKNTFFARVVPGDRYDLYYSAQELGPNVVTNAQAIIQTGIDVGATPVSLTVDVAATALSGNVTLNGAPVTLINGDNLYLKTAAGDQVPLTPSGGAYSALVVQGTYDLYFDSSQSGIADLPETTTKLQSGVVIGPSPLSLDIQIPTPTRVSGTITVNGALDRRQSQLLSGPRRQREERHDHRELARRRCLFSARLPRNVRRLVPRSGGRRRSTAQLQRCVQNWSRRRDVSACARHRHPGRYALGYRHLQRRAEE